jgi:hypothetical protein
MEWKVRIADWILATRKGKRVGVAMVAMVAMVVLAGCSTPAPRDYGGRWKPVNRFAATTTEIPLASAYVFYASPLDGTLKALLTRWSKDTGLQLSFRLGADYTLVAPVATIRTSDLHKAAAELSTFYAAQGILITAEPGQLVVQLASVAVAPPSSLSENVAITGEAAQGRASHGE